MLLYIRFSSFASEDPVVIPNFVKKPILATFQKAVQWNLAWDGRKYRYVFVLAHMRSGSTLLSHIIASHPDFLSAGETFTFYKTPADLQKLIPRTCELLRTLKLKGTLVVDKITMDQYLSIDALSSLPIYKCVILFRAPEASLRSLMTLFGWPEETALDHYVTRLATLGGYGKVLGDRALLVEYGDLVDRSDETLGALTRFFSVDRPFTNNYAKSKVTGKMGDQSENIFSGRIIRTPGHQHSLSVDVINQATLAFQKCRRELLLAGVSSAGGKGTVLSPTADCS
jgi:hypothetical protein